MLFYLTNMFLDITFYSVLWTISKTTNGVYYLVFDNNSKSVTEQDITIENNEKLSKLIKSNYKQQEQLNNLSTKIKELIIIVKHNNTVNCFAK